MNALCQPINHLQLPMLLPLLRAQRIRHIKLAYPRSSQFLQVAPASQCLPQVVCQAAYISARAAAHPEVYFGQGYGCYLKLGNGHRPWLQHYFFARPGQFISSFAIFLDRRVYGRGLQNVSGKSQCSCFYSFCVQVFIGLKVLGLTFQVVGRGSSTQLNDACILLGQPLVVGYLLGELAGAADEQPRSQWVQRTAVAYFHLCHLLYPVNGIKGCPGIGLVYQYYPAFSQFRYIRLFLHGCKGKGNSPSKEGKGPTKGREVLTLQPMSFFRAQGKPFVVAGPCSAETREQVLETAEALSQGRVHLFRAGVWKPRTRPGSFEGNGQDALEWLKEVKQQYKLPVTVEVAEPEHVNLALQHGIDVLWLGARTTVNPFQVQRIADALKGVNIPVMVKNPVNPDVDLWQGAIERLWKAGIADVAAVHRGFSGYGATYRNQPNWPIPIELKRRNPELPVICDPSHITGKRELVTETAQKAMDMGFDGLMIETHPRPGEAWSDAAQQITPQALHTLLLELVIRELHTEDIGKSTELEYLRQLMDSLDAEIIDLLARRLDLSEQIGAVKKACNITAYQPDRWREIVETRGERAQKLNLSVEFIISLYERIHHESIQKQLEVLRNTGKEVKS